MANPEGQAGPIPWYLDAFLGGELTVSPGREPSPELSIHAFSADLPPSLEMADQRRVDLKIYRCWPKEGTVLGSVPRLFARSMPD